MLFLLRTLTQSCDGKGNGKTLASLRIFIGPGFHTAKVTDICQPFKGIAA